MSPWAGDCLSLHPLVEKIRIATAQVCSAVHIKHLPALALGIFHYQHQMEQEEKLPGERRVTLRPNGQAGVR